MIRIYRNINIPIYVLGLELMDLLVLSLAFLVAFNVSSNMFLNGIFLMAVYLFIRAFKKGKPSGYTLNFIRFILQPRQADVRLERVSYPYLDQDQSYESSQN